MYVAYTVYVLYDVCFILVIVGFKSSVELVFVYVYHVPTLNKALLLYYIIIIILYRAQQLTQKLLKQGYVAHR